MSTETELMMLHHVALQADLLVQALETHVFDSKQDEYHLLSLLELTRLRNSLRAYRALVRRKS